MINYILYVAPAWWRWLDNTTNLYIIGRFTFWLQRASCELYEEDLVEMAEKNLLLNVIRNPFHVLKPSFLQSCRTDLPFPPKLQKLHSPTKGNANNNTQRPLQRHQY